MRTHRKRLDHRQNKADLGNHYLRFPDNNMETKDYLCLVISRAMAKMQMNQLAMANYLGCSRSVVSEVQNRKINRLSFNQLFEILGKVAPYYGIAIDLHKKVYDENSNAVFMRRQSAIDA